MSIRALGSTRHRVPVGLVLIATALVLTGVLGLVASLGAHPRSVSGAVVSALVLVAAAGVLRLRPWALWLTRSLLAVALATELYRVATGVGSGDWIRLLVTAGCLAYLVRPKVRGWFV